MPPFDKRVQAEAATQSAGRRIIDAGFGDLLRRGFHVRVLSDEVIKRRYGSSAWLGRYMPGSVRSPRGLTAELAFERHDGHIEMAETLVHESGHGLFELLSEELRAAWNREAIGHPLGPEECFADDFMYLTNQPYLMRYPDLFETVVCRIRR